ncbi:hypothetical protein [Geoalkalibacter subterraneus]|uniref:hypothetical protein n=1 Tax=Geoalkalibacter subterraneus TaxID=483547 RepID=UPI00118563D2|nr:hypothetical protein [Geoalkalibacter subterraneus]
MGPRFRDGKGASVPEGPNGPSRGPKWALGPSNPIIQKREHNLPSKKVILSPFSKVKNEIRTGMLFSGRMKRQNILRKIKKMAGIKKLSNVLGIICKKNKQKIFAKYFGRINTEETRNKISLILWEDKF